VYLLAYCAFKLKKYEECDDYIDEYKDSENNIKDEEIEEAMEELIMELNKIKQLNKGNLSQGMEETGEHNEEDIEDEWMDVEDDEN
jgi:hypothetical protein